MKNINIVQEGKDVFETEIQALKCLQDSLNTEFEVIVKLIAGCKGKVIVTGMGKSGHIASKIAATLSSLGTPSFFLHPGEALHGDLGMVSKSDIVIAISNSGESEEIINIIPNIKLIGARLIGISGNKHSTLIQNSDLSFVFPKIREACSLELAPTSSTTATLVFGDALAVTLSKLNGFAKEDYALIHPAGSLGKKLLIHVKDIMLTGLDNAVVKSRAHLKDTIIEMSRTQLGMVNIVDDTGKLQGIFTDGDLRRLLDKNINIYDLIIDTVMTKDPITITETRLAVDALTLINNTKKQITALPVLTESGALAGTVRIYDIVNKGIML